MNFRRWPNDHPFLLAVIVLLAVVLPGFLRVEHIANRADDAAVKAQAAADAAQSQADRNLAIVSCLTTYAADLTDALQDRDVVNKTATTAERQWVRIFLRLVEDTTPPPDAREQFIAASERYDEIIGRLQRTEAINPYPDITTCLPVAVVTAAYRLVAAYRHLKCLGMPATIYGTPRDDVIHGTDHRDVIRAFDGDDLIFTGAGRDYICAGKGDDTINGGRGYDRARGQMGSDFCIQVEFKRSC